jgi:ABC-type transport system involved in multi-copper enzyme maturation permease subunit
VSGVVFLETVRRHVTSVGYLVFLGFVAIVAFGVSRFNAPGAGWPTLIGLLAIVVGCGPIGPEFSSGTLQLILVKPVNRVVYLLSRVAGVVVGVWIAAAVAAACEMIGRLAWGEGAAPWAAMGRVLVNTGAEVVLTCALLVLLGSLTRAYFNAAIYVALQFGLAILGGILGMIRMSRGAVGQFLSQHTGIERGLAVVTNNLFPEAPSTLDRNWMLMVLSNAAAALVLAALAFRRREVPY